MLILRFIASVRTGIVLLSVVFVYVLAGTIAQGVLGPIVVQESLFSRFFFPVGSVWIPGLPTWLAVCSLQLALSWILLLPYPPKAWGTAIVHFALVLFCIGGIASTAGKEEYSLGLTVGSSTRLVFVKNSTKNEVKELPFELTALDFAVRYYPLSDIPRDYESRIRIRGTDFDRTSTVKMNHPLRVGDYTVYQSSLETVSGRAAPVFKIVRDPWGFFPYAASIVFALGFALMATTRWFGRKETDRA